MLSFALVIFFKPIGTVALLTNRVISPVILITTLRESTPSRMQHPFSRTLQRAINQLFVSDR